MTGIYVDGAYLRATNASWHVEDSPWKTRNIVTMMERNELAPSSVCDVGCGAGEVVRLLSLHYPDARFVGYDISPQARELNRQRESATVSFEQADLLDQDVRFDLLIAADVFEHVDDYMGFLRRLKPKADFKLFHVPLDVSVWSVLYGSMMTARHEVGHLHYFTHDTALATLRDCGYEIVDSFYTAAFTDRPSKSKRGLVANALRRSCFRLSPGLTATVFGGCSMMVLAR